MPKRWEPGRYARQAADDEARQVTEHVRHLGPTEPGLLARSADISDEDFEALKARYTEKLAAAFQVPLFMVLGQGVQVRRRPWWRRALAWLAARRFRIRLVRDRSLVDKPCLQFTTRGWDLYVWRHRETPWRVRFTLLERDETTW